MERGVELPDRELFELGFGDPPLGLEDRAEHLLVRLVHVLDLDPGLHALALGDHRRGPELLLGQGDGQGAERGPVRVVPELALELLDLGAPHPSSRSASRSCLISPLPSLMIWSRRCSIVRAPRSRLSVSVYAFVTS
nr:hypothetical protein [Gemmata massiliana]